MRFDSRTRVVEQKVAVFPLYLSSDPTEGAGSWIQPPISHPSIDLAGSTIIDGIYIKTRHPEIMPIIEPDLAWELEAWEAASDEALMLFEAECD